MIVHKLALVAAGGAAGSVLRFVVATLVVPTGRFPVGTLVVNATGSFLMGLAIPWTEGTGAPRESLRAFFVAGALGGYTTFSAFSGETFALLRAGRLPAAVANAVGSIVLGVALLALGYALGRAWRSA